MSSSIPLTQAVTAGDERAVSALLANGADVNETTSGGQTALILAIIFGHTNVVRLLVNAGADPHLRDNLGLNAIEWAQRRGLTEALSILTNTSQPATAPRRIVVNLEEPEESVPPAPPPETEEREKVPHDEKSRRWLAGLKQRMTELEGRRLNRNEPHPERPTPPAAPPAAPPEPPPLRSEPPAVEKAPPLMTAATREAPIAETEPVATAATTKSAPRKEPPKGRILVPPENIPAKSGKRKRCPQCNAIYDSDLLMYCSHHIVPLVDADEPVIPEPPKTTNTLFWTMIGITLAGSILLGSLITSYLYKTTHPDPLPNTAVPQSTIQKGFPEVSSELAGKAVSLPEAQCPVTGLSGPISGTVTVRVLVDKKGQVSWAKGSGGDWLMRGAATEAAMKSTFSPEKLRSRETEGTITYTFKP